MFQHMSITIQAQQINLDEPIPADVDVNPPIKVENAYTKNVKPNGNSARIGCKKKYEGKRALVLILEDEN